ncbi:LysR family transcriptional regulator [Nocardia tengchongensis]|uniref:LysR family transcriptional regulator n=1 Tax=Nocardia tengchongensis TaxID=2055889 RepID=UPI0036A16D25
MPEASQSGGDLVTNSTIGAGDQRDRYTFCVHVPSSTPDGRRHQDRIVLGRYARGMDLLETRDLVYFVAVAEELHFGRAAQKVGIAQPALSRAIARLERRLGVALLYRTSRNVELTAAGKVLLREATRALDAVAGAACRTRRAVEDAHLVLAMKAGTDAGVIDQIVCSFRSDPAAVPVEIVHSVDQRIVMLRDGRADLALLHRPNNDLTGLHTLDLITETQIAVLAPDHPLASRAALSVSDLIGEPIARWPETAPGPGTDNRPLIRDTGHLTHLAATRRAVALLPASAAGQVPRSLSCLPVLDAEPTTSVLAWLPETDSPALAAFLHHARDIASAANLDRTSRRTDNAATTANCCTPPIRPTRSTTA